MVKVGQTQRSFKLFKINFIEKNLYLNQFQERRMSDLEEVTRADTLRVYNDTVKYFNRPDDDQSESITIRS